MFNKMVKKFEDETEKEVKQVIEEIHFQKDKQDREHFDFVEELELDPSSGSEVGSPTFTILPKKVNLGVCSATEAQQKAESDPPTPLIQDLDDEVEKSSSSSS